MHTARSFRTSLSILALVASLPWHAAHAQDASPGASSRAPIEVSVTPLAPRTEPCRDPFVTHTLDHVTQVAGGVVRMFEANGAGLAVGDLDNDGDLDLLLGNHDGADHLFWNEGNLQFRREDFSAGKTRAVVLADVDADGWLDVTLTRNTGALNFYRNLGGAGAPGQFAREVLPGVAAPAYVVNWADLDGDGDLDLVTGTYDAGLLTDRGSSYLVSGTPRGVFYYENRGGRFALAALSQQAQALAILFPDLNLDGRLDIVVGNDFDVPDMIWLRTDAGWQPAEPFVSTTHSTMSYDQGDLNNDGRFEIFSSDMKPYAGERAGGWAPMMDSMMIGMVQAKVAAERQIMENVLLTRGDDGRYWNVAPDWGVDGTGWTWSSRFGDLNNDGYLDLYSVNGMIEETLFTHLPDHELVEENQAFRNEEGLHFEPMPGWELDSTHSGRGMVLADLDQDGDLDIVVNNLRGPARLFENRLCAGDALEVDLRWPGSGNTQALGARLRLHTGEEILLRDVRAGSGYLSGDAPRVHFGFPPGAALHTLEILWPDGATTELTNLQPNTRLTVERR